MIGPTGVGKTEIARRLAKLTNSPFLKVEASKFTEVGYVGRDVESIVRDLVEIAIDLVRDEKLEDVEDKAELHAEDRPPRPAPAAHPLRSHGRQRRRRDRGCRHQRHPAPHLRWTPSLQTTSKPVADVPPADDKKHEPTSYERTREKLRQQFREGKLDDRTVELDVRDRNQPTFEFIASLRAMDESDMSLKDVLPGLFGQRTKKRKMKVAEAFDYLVQEEEQRLIDMDQVTRLAVERVEDSGIVFLDEIDKIAGREGEATVRTSPARASSATSLPIVEGTTVSTKYGMVSTDHILFIAAGAFPRLETQRPHP